MRFRIRGECFFFTFLGGLISFFVLFLPSGGEEEGEEEHKTKKKPKKKKGHMFINLIVGKKIINKSNRYLTKNTFVLCVETLTVLLWGPGCFLVAALILQRSPWRYPLQIIVSMGQLYGDALYYATSFFDHAVHGISYSRPEALYFWCYFVGCNAVSFLLLFLLFFLLFVFSFFKKEKAIRKGRRRRRGDGGRKKKEKKENGM